MMALVLKKLAPQPNGSPVFHFAPDQGLFDFMQGLFGDSYVPADLCPENYAHWPVPVRKVDLTNPAAYLEPESVQGLIHSHVLEHVPADIGNVIRAMNAAIEPGGFHAFIVPFLSRYYREDISPDAPAEERERLFGQHDHVRAFGRVDFQDRIMPMFDGFERVRIDQVLTHDDLARAAVAGRALTRVTSHSVFFFRKREPTGWGRLSYIFQRAARKRLANGD